MNITYLDHLPAKIRRPVATKLGAVLEDFKKAPQKVARIEWRGEYKKAIYARNAFHSHINHFRVSGVALAQRGDEVYLVKV